MMGTMSAGLSRTPAPTRSDIKGHSVGDASPYTLRYQGCCTIVGDGFPVPRGGWSQCGKISGEFAEGFSPSFPALIPCMFWPIMIH